MPGYACVSRNRPIADCRKQRRRRQWTKKARRRGQAVSGPGKPKVLDIGCGTGAQTIQLARQIDGTILAVDNHQSYLDALQRRAQAEGVAHKIRPCLKNMADLGLENGFFDLIWSEGALSLMGFREGLVMCNKLLAAGGMMAVSELCWFRPDPPEDCRQFFAEHYPAMADVDANLAMIADCGYDFLGYFTLPESCWLKDFYVPLEQRIQLFRKTWAEDPERMAVADAIQLEIEIYRKHSRYYGYVFCLMGKS
ncbi:MAG: class I SAM-dependent methyltransferase [Desulfosarcinaceae bacterium]